MDNYEDIINLKHPEPKHHVRMFIYARSAQFAPFAALTGYEDFVEELQEFLDTKGAAKYKELWDLYTGS